MRTLQHTSWAVALFAFLAPLPAMAAAYYVAPNGVDSAAGSQAAPWATFAQAQSVATAGDTVYFRGGKYLYTTATNTCGANTGATVDSIVLNKSGTSGNPINYFAYPGEKPVFDFSGVTDMNNYNCRHTGVRVTGSWLHLKGLEFTGVLQLNNLNHESWCVYVYGGSNNTFELLDAHHNMGPGFFIQRGGNNLFLNCDSHENEDTLTSNGDGQSADGFGCHPNRAGDTGNVFRGCRAWWNSDDNWDMINATEACTVENSWAWYAGYKPDAISGGKPVVLSAGNGNGFKGGGYGMPPTNVPSPTPLHIIRFNAAFYNKANGVYANHSPVSVYFYNNTSYNNGTDFDMLGVASDGSTSISVGILRNNLAFAGTLTSSTNLGGLIDDQYNSWDSNMGLTVANADFQSVAFAPPASCPAAYSPGGTVCVPPTDTTSFAGMASARQGDGSLPVLPFLRLAPGSKLIDKGINVGLPYNGSAPDLGCFETGSTGGVPNTGGAPSTGGTKASGGVTSAGGAKATGGTISASTGGSKAATGGTASTVGGGISATGGAFVTGGSTVVTPTGGANGNGGAKATGGMLATTGGNAAAGGTPGTGGLNATGGALAIGGLANLGGGLAGGAGAVGGNGNTGGTRTGDTSSSSDTGGGSISDTGGCGCRVPSGQASLLGNTGRLTLLGLACVGLLRQRRTRVTRGQARGPAHTDPK